MRPFLLIHLNRPHSPAARAALEARLAAVAGLPAIAVEPGITVEVLGELADPPPRPFGFQPGPSDPDEETEI